MCKNSDSFASSSSGKLKVHWIQLKWQWPEVSLYLCERLERETCAVLIWKICQIIQFLANSCDFLNNCWQKFPIDRNLNIEWNLIIKKFTDFIYFY